jgi:hypothetical protein
MQQFTFNSEYIFMPLPFNMYQRPLSPAKAKMLNAR